MEELFDVRFLVSESNFIYNFGINRGHTISCNKVDRCLLLSSEAKQLYRNLCGYAYGHKRDCFPSQVTLCLELGWSRGTVVKYIEELKSKGFIYVVSQGVGKPILYNMVDLSQVSYLVHSELIYSYKQERKIGLEACDKFREVINVYAKSEMMGESYSDLVKHKEALFNWFDNELNKPILPAAFDSCEQEKKSKKEVGKWSSVSEWNAYDFLEYFCQRCFEVLKVVYTSKKADIHAMRRLLKNVEKEDLKTKIDAYTALEYFEIKTVTNFSSQYVQSVLDYYIRTGNLPKQKPSKEGTVDEVWVRGLNDLFE